MPMEMFSSEKNIITPEKVSAVPFGLLNIMVEGMILSAVKQEHIQSAQLPGWCFFFFPSTFQTCIIPASSQMSRRPGWSPSAWKAGPGR